MWETVCVSVQGPSHDANGIPGQDYGCTRTFANKDSSIVVIAVADGAGSAKHSHIGSQFVCENFLSEIEARLLEGSPVRNFDEAYFKAWLGGVKKGLGEIATSDTADIRDYACTFLGAIIGESAACFAQIGDGAIVFRGWAEAYDFVFSPQRGEYANQTFFVTDEVSETTIVHQFFEREITEIAVFTDGLQNLVLDLRENTVNHDFFSQWFEWLLQPQDPKVQVASLAQYLSSKKISDLSDDDKTLALAIRRGP